MITFSELGLSAPILQALRGEGYESPTPIQAKAIPIVLTGRDLLGIAQTGTGKTAAFALPIIHRLASEKRPAQPKSCRVLVLAPTRELATQIAQSFRTYGRNHGITVAVVFGGVGHRPQINAMSRGVDVLVATPGRLLDHLGDRSIRLATTEVLVLDEADHMLDLGFLPPIRRIVGQLPSQRQNLFFSATMPPEIGKLAGELLHDPARVAVTPTATTVDSVQQRVFHVDAHSKRSVLVELLADPIMSRTLVFTRTKRGADKVAQHLKAAGIPAAAMHGNKSQAQREQALGALRASKIRVLVATDIAARGIDIDLVTHVVNYELPDVPESYVHRIGRTARAGASGIAISLCEPEERGQLRDIERLTRQSIPNEDRRADQASAIPEHTERARPATSRGRHSGRPAPSGKRPPNRWRNRDKHSGGPEASHASAAPKRHRQAARPRPPGEAGRSARQHTAR